MEIAQLVFNVMMFGCLGYLLARKPVGRNLDAEILRRLGECEEGLKKRAEKMESVKSMVQVLDHNVVNCRREVAAVNQRVGKLEYFLDKVRIGSGDLLVMPNSEELKSRVPKSDPLEGCK